jgi:hypothetical protein
MGLFSVFAKNKTYEAAVMHDALELRRRYGPEAEDWCEQGMYSAPSAATRRMLKRIHRVLAHLPIDDALPH